MIRSTAPRCAYMVTSKSLPKRRSQCRARAAPGCPVCWRHLKYLKI